MQLQSGHLPTGTQNEKYTGTLHIVLSLRMLSATLHDCSQNLHHSWANKVMGGRATHLLLLNSINLIIDARLIPVRKS